MSIGQLPLYLIIQPTGPFQGHQTNQPREYTIYNVNKAVTITFHFLKLSPCEQFQCICNFHQIPPVFLYKLTQDLYMARIYIVNNSHHPPVVVLHTYIKPAPFPIEDKKKKSCLFHVEYVYFHKMLCYEWITGECIYLKHDVCQKQTFYATMYKLYTSKT